MAKDVNTLRLTEFKGLNKSVNPHNIDDAEFTELINAELTPNRTIQSRMGYVSIAPNSAATAITCLHKTAWAVGDERLYSADSYRTLKINETAGTATSLALTLCSAPATMLRYKDKTLALYPGQTLKWFDTTESIKSVQLPTVQVGTTWNSVIAASAGGNLDAGTVYQYGISLVLGSDRRDGETCLSLPGIDIVWKPGKDLPGIVWPSAHAWEITTTDNKTLGTSTGIPYSGTMHGYVPFSIRFFRKKSTLNTYTQGSTTYLEVGAEEEQWLWLDEAYLETNDGGATYTISATNYGVIDNTSTISVSGDVITIALKFSDTGKDTYRVSYQPRDRAFTIDPKAKYMTRLNNRIVLANAESTNTIDRKAVYFSYRPLGLNDVESEIPDFLHDKPMLIFPIYNQFYCDMEDVEDEITGLSTYQDNLIIFTQRCMFLWRDTSPKMADPIKISDDVGCIANRTICEFEGRLVWLGTNGVFVFDGKTLKNISQEKIEPYISALSKSYSDRACAAMYGRRYYLAAPFSGGAVNDTVLVYDFDLDEWHARQYKYDATYSLNLTALYTYRDGSQETLYGAGVPSGGAGSAGYCRVVKLENGYIDNATAITATLKTKYYDFRAPDVVKRLRNYYIDVENYSRGLSIDLYVDNLKQAVDSFTFTGTGTGFIVNDVTGLGNVNEDYIVNTKDEMFAFSLNRGIQGARFQFGISLTAYAAPVKIHAMAVDWRLKRRVDKKYGG